MATAQESKRTDLHTPLCDLLGCRYPIVQTAMGWVADAGLVAGTCNAGGFGFLAAATMGTEELESQIQRVRALTDAPFGVNFHMFQPNAHEVVDLVVRHGVRAVSYGRAPDAATVRKLKDAGVLCVPTAGAVRHAIKAVELGADIVTVQGGEGGGHTGNTPTSLLLPQALDAVDVPVVAAGGFYDGRGLAAALAWGASGIAMGTRFLLTDESPVPRATLERYLAERDPGRIRVSRALDGLPQRMVDNEYLSRLERAGALRRLGIALAAALKWKRRTGMTLGQMASAAVRSLRDDRMTLAQTLMAANAPVIIQKAMVEGEPGEGVLPSGQVAAMIDRLSSCQEVIDGIVAQASERLLSLSANHIR